MNFSLFQKMNWTQLLEHYLAVDNDGEVDDRASEAIGAIFGEFSIFGVFNKTFVQKSPLSGCQI